MEKTQNVQHTLMTLAGTPYEIGRQQGEMIRSIPPFARYMTSGPEEWAAQHYAEEEALYRQFCPGLLEEVQGVADVLQVPPARVRYNYESYLIPPRCSHFALLPQITQSGHTLVGRSYEFGSEMNDNRLLITRPQGKYSHIGPSSILLGRLDGMNDQGLVVTMSAGGIPVGLYGNLRPPVQKGFHFWVVIRSILENCRNVDEGLAWLKQVPCGGNPILILADRTGKAARAEVYGPSVCVEEIGPHSAAGHVCATNHFLSPALQPHSTPARRNSLTRLQRIEEMVEQAGKGLEREDARRLLSTLYPHGLCCHFYKEFFGTLYSEIFDPMAGTLEMCFGSPAAGNAWHTFTLDEAPQTGTFEARLPQADGFQEFWN